MIYYHCHGCQKRQAPGNTACWNCGAAFPRAVPFEKPLVVVVDRETREYRAFDPEWSLDMRTLPPKYIRKAIKYGDGCYKAPYEPRKGAISDNPKAADAVMYIVATLSVLGMIAMIAAVVILH